MEIVWLVVLGTSIWVLFDANSIGVKKGQIKGMGDMGPWGWFFVCLLLWIVGFPVYLSKRAEYIRINSTNDASAQANAANLSGEQSKRQGSLDLEQIEKLAALKERGVITEEEFQSKKKEMLGM